MKTTAILTNIQNQDLYRHLEGDNYLNLRTGIKGVVPEDLANKVFKLNIDYSFLLNKFPDLEIMIEKLKLKSV